MTSPGLEPPSPPENPSGLPVYRPALRFRFPEGWDITIHVSDGSWWAAKDTRMFTHPTEGGLFALVMDSERRRALKDL